MIVLSDERYLQVKVNSSNKDCDCKAKHDLDYIDMYLHILIWVIFLLEKSLYLTGILVKRLLIQISEMANLMDLREDGLDKHDNQEKIK